MTFSFTSASSITTDWYGGTAIVTGSRERSRRNAIAAEFIRAAALVACLSVIGCGEGVFGGSTLDKLGMNAADYFEDAEVIALCEAVERGDLAEVEALINLGSDVTAVGKHGVTPLLWAYPDDKPEIFEALLEAGADPNVKLTADLGDGRWFNEGDSVTHLCVKSSFDRHFYLVMDHGGDPNITDGRGTTALVTVIRWGRNKKARIKRLVKEGADLNQETRNLARPISVAVTWGAQYDIAILLLELGAEANPDVGGRTLSIPHQVLYEKGEKRYRLWTPEAEASYAALKTAMAERGVDWEEEKASRDARLRKSGVIE